MLSQTYALQCVRMTYSGFMKVKHKAASLSNRFTCLSVLRNHLQSLSIMVLRFTTRNRWPKPGGSRLLHLPDGTGRSSITLSIFMFTAGRLNYLSSRSTSRVSLHFFLVGSKWNAFKICIMYCEGGKWEGSCPGGIKRIRNEWLPLFSFSFCSINGKYFEAL